jgi:hypothetical protein
MSLTLARFAALQKTQTVAVRRLVDLTLRHAAQSSKIGAEYLNAVLGVQQESMKQLAASSTPVDLAASQIAFAQSFAQPAVRHANELYQVLSTTRSEALSIAVDAAVSALEQRWNETGAASRFESLSGAFAAAPPAANDVAHGLTVATDEATAATREAVTVSAGKTTDALTDAGNAQAATWAAGASQQRDAVPEAASPAEGAAPADEAAAAQALGEDARDESTVAVPAASGQHRAPFLGPASSQPASAKVAAAKPARRVKAPARGPSGGDEATHNAGTTAKRSISASRVKR